MFNCWKSKQPIIGGTAQISIAAGSLGSKNSAKGKTEKAVRE
jgi:hypothetical protein